MLDNLKVNAFDSQKNTFYPAQICKKSDSYSVESCDDAKSDLYLSPGWIDMHTHIFEGFGLFGTNADDIGYKTGCCMLVDAGTVGGYTLAGFRKYVEPTIRTNIKLFLCISPIGVIFHHEYNAMQYLNADETVKIIEENRDIISGVKVRIGSEVIRHEGIEPLRIASEAARRVGLPLMVHVGGIPPTIDEVEPFLQKGDVITHIFNGRGGDCWLNDGKPSKAVEKMISRGVILDVGHGSASFSFDVCEKALKHDLPKFCVGTDLHSKSRYSLAFDMATTMTKLMGLGMKLEDIIYGATRLPAEVLRLENWCDLGNFSNATLFKVIDAPDTYYDCCEDTRHFDKKIVPVGVLLNGTFYDL